jgi:hypothetical protein
MPNPRLPNPHPWKRTDQGVCEAVIAVPAPAEDTASIELAGTADGTATAKPEALGSCAGGEARLERDMKARKGVGATRCHETTWPWRERAVEVKPGHSSYKTTG